jgi:hypothetical protein
MELMDKRNRRVRARLAFSRNGGDDRARERASFNGATGTSDIEGKAARVAASEMGTRASFN